MEKGKSKPQKNNCRELYKIDMKNLIFLEIVAKYFYAMSSNQITQAQQAIESLKSEVKNYLKKPIHEALPHISKRLSKLSEINLKTTRYPPYNRSQINTSRMETEPMRKRPSHTISVQKVIRRISRAKNREEIEFLQSTHQRGNRIMLPNMINRTRNVRDKSETGFNLEEVEDSLVQEKILKIIATRESNLYTFVNKKAKRTPKISPQPRKSTKTTLDVIHYAQVSNPKSLKTIESGYGPWPQPEEKDIHAWFPV